MRKLMASHPSNHTSEPACSDEAPFDPENPRHSDAGDDRGELTPEQYRGLSLGGGWILGGFAVGLFAVALMLRGRILEFVHLPLLALGLASCAHGSYCWTRIPTFSKESASRSKQALVTALLGLYFSPFLYWWTRNPSSYYYAINSLLFAMAISMLLLHLNGFAHAFARHTRDHLFATETRLCGWIILVVVGTYFLNTFIQLLVYQFSHGGHMFPYQVMRSGWFFLLAPIALTAAGIHKIRTVSNAGKPRTSTRRTRLR